MESGEADVKVADAKVADAKAADAAPPNTILDPATGRFIMVDRENGFNTDQAILCAENRRLSEDNRKLTEQVEALNEKVQSLRAHILSGKENERPASFMEDYEVITSERVKLGNAINVQLVDTEANDLLHFTQKIAALKRNLEQFASNLAERVDKSHIDYYMRRARLADNCDTSNSLLIQVLQRTIIQDAISILDQPEKTVHTQPVCIDRNLAQSTVNLCEDLERFRKVRCADDKIVRSAPIKIRQHMFGTLSTYGFKGPDNRAVTSTVKAFFRSLNISNASAEEIKETSELVVSCASTLYFARMSFEPKPQFTWIDAGTPVDNALMEVTCDVDGSRQPELEVRYCYFPLIKTHKTFSKAKVLTRPSSKPTRVASTKAP